MVFVYLLIFVSFFCLPVADDSIGIYLTTMAMRESFRCFGVARAIPCVEPWHFITDTIDGCDNSESDILQNDCC